MSKLAKYKEVPKSALIHTIDSLKEANRKKGELGGVGPAVIGNSVNMVARHALTGLLGDPRVASTAQRVVLAIVGVAAGAFRVGVSNSKARASTTAAAAAAEGLFFACGERLAQGLAGVPPA